MKNDINDPRFAGDGPSAAYAFERNRLVHLGASPEEAHQAGLKAHLAPFEKMDGIGAKGHETGNHYAGILKYEGRESWEIAVRDQWKRDPKHAAEIGLPNLRHVGT